MKEARGWPSLKKFRVPFSIGELWSKGCDGNQWWFDRYGDEFLLLLSGEGEAYVCPSDASHEWRIYSNSSGRAFKFNGWPARGRSYSSEDATEEMGRMMACALMTIDDIAPAICSVAMGKALAAVSRSSLALGGMEIQLGEEGWRRWRLRLDSGEARVFCQDRGIVADAVPVIVEKFDGVRRIASVSDLGCALKFLNCGIKSSDCAGRVAIEIARASFERAWGNVQSIEKFERECRKVR